MLGLGLGRNHNEYKRKATFPAFTNASIQNANGFVFDGTGDYLSVADHDDWVQRDAVSGNEALFSKAASSNYEYRIFFF